MLVRRAVTISVVRGTNRRRLARSLLALLWLETAWAAGELVGYITSAPE